MRILFFGALWLAAHSSVAQRISDYQMDGSEAGKSLPDFFNELEQAKVGKIYFLSDWIEEITFQQSYQGQTLGQALDDLFRGSDLSYLTMYSRILVIVKDPSQSMKRKTAIESALRMNKKIESRYLGENGNGVSGEVTIKGKVIDAKTLEPLPKASVQIIDSNVGTSTDENGDYEITLSPGVHMLSFTFIDYEEKLIDLVAYADGVVNLEMEEKPILLNEVLIQDRAARDITTSKIGLTQLMMGEIKRAPAMMGEPDLVKQVQTLAGVTTVGEAAAGYNVRGGSVDQNLILYDGLPVFNSSHLFGFFSTFNAQAIRDVYFYKGGIPAEYGGRASSILDIRSKDGDFTKWGGGGGIGLIASHFDINGPIKKEKTSIATSFRSTYSNWLVNSIRTDYADLRKSSVFFYDGTLKLAHLFNEKTKLSFTGYASKDAFRLLGDTTYSWNNLQGSWKLDHQFTSSLSSEFLAGLSHYGYDVHNDNYLTASVLSFRINSITLKAGFNYRRGNHKYNFGWQLLHYGFNPGSLRPNSPVSPARNFSLDKQYAIENAFYLADDLSITEGLFLDVGVRIPVFTSFGPASIKLYQQGAPREVIAINDTLQIGKFKSIKTYLGFEPRLSFRWMATPNSSIKFGYNRMYQFLHLITNSTAVTPVDIWQPSGYYFKPQIADQVSLGYFKDFKNKKYGVTVEGYYKFIKNIIDFKDGAQLILNSHLETDLLQGNGYSSGVETSLTKNEGRLTGSLNYTYSRSFRKIAGTFPGESINRGMRYPANFDQPHILNFSWKYDLSRRHFFTGNFTYHSGRPVTIPLSVFQFENTTSAYFSGRNQYRIPDYHRLDLALVIEGNHKRNQRIKGSWTFSVYNVYGRKNPYSIFFRSDGNGIPKPYQLAIIGTVFPSISYSFKF